MSNTTPESPDADAFDRFALPPLPGVTDHSDAPASAVDNTAVTPLAGIAEALEVLDQIAPSQDATPPPPPEPDADTASSAADDRVFASAASQMSDAPAPTDDAAAAFGVLQAIEPVVPMTLTTQSTADDLVDDLLPEFLRAETAVAVAEAPVPAFAPATPPVAEMRDVPTKAKPSVARTVAEIPVLLIVAAVIAFLVKTFLAQAYYIPSGSMLPQLQIDDRVVVSKLAYKAHDPRRGDIIVFDDPRPGVDTTETVERTGVAKLLRNVGEGIGVIQPSTDEFIKRVIGLPGDKVEGHDGHVYINGHKLLEPYLKASVETSDFPEQTIEKGKLWVMGDNRTGSADSRVFGQIKISTIVGRAVVKVWPFSHISFL